MASCRVYRESDHGGPLPDKCDPKANPGEFGLWDHEDGTVTLTIVDPHGSPSPIEPGAAEITIESDAPDIMDVAVVDGYTFRESVGHGLRTVTRPPPPVVGTAPLGPHRPGKRVQPARQAPQAPTASSVSVVVNIKMTVTWADGRAPHTLTWADSVTASTGPPAFERGTITVV